MTDEVVDYFDENYQKLGSTTLSEVRKNGLWCAVFHCWVFNPSDGGYLIFQRRGSTKLVYPDKLDISAAGHYRSGEAIEDGIRELTEELGIVASFNELISLGIRLDISHYQNLFIRQICHVFLLQNHLNLDQYNNIGTNEVDGIFEIPIPNGLALFSDEKKTIEISGREYDNTAKRWYRRSIEVNKNSFVPRLNSYYLKMFIMCDLLKKGGRYLAV